MTHLFSLAGDPGLSLEPVLLALVCVGLCVVIGVCMSPAVHQSSKEKPKQKKEN